MSLNRLLSRSKTVICKCRSNCTVYQPSTGEYTGLGQTISRSTRDRHSRDDKLLAAEIKRTSPNGRPPRHMDTQENHGDLINLFEEEVNWRIELPLTSPTSPLVFLNDPRGSGGYVSPSLADIIHPNRGVYALKMGSHSNAAFLEVETRFCELLSVLISMEGSEANHTLQDRLYEELCRMYREKGIEWAQQRVDLAEGNILVNTEIHYYERGPRNPIAKAASLTTLVMGNLYFASRRALRAQLAGLKDILRNSGASEENIEMIPKDPRAAYSHFRLEAVTRKFISCPSCSCLYPYNPGDNPEIPHHSTIEKCTYRKTPDSSPCDTLVWKQRKTNGGRTISVPCSTYLHQVLKFWLGRLLSRKGLEDLLDRCQHATPPDANSPIPDIWFSQIFSDLRDAQGDPFFPGPAEEGRLVFGLSVDGFNPFHMKTAKQTASSTGIWLVLLNFPPHLRYLPENMFLVGVLPDKPSQDQINHGLALVVGDLLEFWIPGVYFSRTYKHRLGKLYRAMLVPLVADMIAARQVLGLPGVTTAHYFCTFCDLDIDDIDVFDPAEWPQKNVDDIRQFAKLWRDAPNEDEQTQIFEAYGRRWTVLLDLPYWNPVLYAVIDSMHALDLGLFQNHCRKLFKIDLNVAGGDGATDPQPPKDKRTADRTSLRKCVEIVHSNAPDMLHKLLKVHRKVLYTVCIDNNIRGANNNLVVGTRWILANNIYQWRQGADTGLIQGLLQPTPGPSQIPVNLGPNPGNSPETPQLEEQDGIDLGKVIRIIGHLTSDHDGVARRGRALSQSSSAILRYIIDLIELDRSTISDRSKALLFALLITSIDNDREKFDKLASYIPVKAANRIVLGRDIMEAVWADMKRTQLPMWIRSAPPNWGTAERGKLSAEQWRVICTIHLPITLIRLWGNETGRKKELLSHFMDLVSAVRIANMRISSSDQIRAYRHHIFRYASRCAALYPDESIKPTLHAALHLCDTMELFGPVHAISAPFYERYINFFHRMNTNKKLGELESTFMRTAARTSSLRALLVDDDDLRGTVIRMVAALDSTEREDVRGYRLASILDPDAPTFTVDSKGRSFELEDECSQLLWALILPHPEHHSLPRKALSVDQISSGGASYATFGSSASRNSSILFHLADTQHTATQNQKAGVIQTIFQYTYLSATEEVSNFYLLVQEYRSMDIGGRRMDPYKRLGFAAGFLCKANETKLHVISLRQVISHVAFTTMTGTGYDHEQLMHAMPVDRLMLSFNLDDVEDDVTMAHMDTTDE